MLLVHYSKKPISKLLPVVKPQRIGFKPIGLWISDQSEPRNWFDWCLDEEYHLDILAFAYIVELKANPNILFITSLEELKAFSIRFYAPDYYIDWPKVRANYAGIVISPYRYDARNVWYYGWDVASGCIWDISAISSFTLLPTSPLFPLSQGTSS